MSGAESLFVAIANGRPERLAQLLLGHAVKTDGRLRRAFCRSREPSVEYEVYPGRKRSGWRADIAVDAKSAYPRYVELKIWAGLSQQQKAALRSGAMTDVVVPSSRKDAVAKELRRCGGKAQLHSWKDLARLADDKSVRRLLKEADDIAEWYVFELDEERLELDFTAFESGDVRSGWRKMNAFLWTASTALENDGHVVNAGWSHSRRDPTYYGFYFGRGNAERSPTFWVGFTQKGSAPVLELWHGESICRRIEQFSVDEVRRVVAAQTARHSRPGRP